MGISKLPSETFTSIVSYLNTRDKLSCLCVSPYWYGLIMGSCLYQDLVFVNGDAMNRLKQAFTHKNESMGKQVTCLEVQLNNQPDVYIMLSLPRLMPSLPSFKWKLKDHWNNNYVEGLEEVPPGEVSIDVFKYWGKLEEVNQVTL